MSSLSGACIRPTSTRRLGRLETQDGSAEPCRNQSAQLPAISLWRSLHLWRMVMKCDLCKEPVVETLEFEGGNNADLSTILGLCEAHLAEYDKDEYAFQQKYADKINKGCYEQLISNAEARMEENR